jgi:hypothetical protein
MTRPSRIEGFAIVSDDGMLAGADKVMPEALKFDADQRYFADGLDRCDAVIHGRHSHEQQPHSPRRRRITVSNRIETITPDPDNTKGILWNPSGAPFEKAWDALGIGSASLGVVGATSVFGMFLDTYDAFHLSHAPGVKLPGGVPVFPGVPRQTPQQALAQHGLAPGPAQVLDAAHGLTVTVWRRGK